MAFISGFGGVIGSSFAGSSVAVCESKKTNAVVMKVEGAAVNVVKVGSSPSPLVAKLLGRRTTAISKKAGSLLTPTEAAADAFFAQTVTRKFKEMVNWTGVYDPQCTEGTAKGEAWDKRELAVSKQFRFKQRSAAQKAGDFFENRRLAIHMVGHICAAEEALLGKYPTLAASYIMGKTEANKTCNRYTTPDSVAEAYMAASIESQNKKRGAPFGVYLSSCVDGNAKGRAEAARVAAVNTAYRAGWKSPAQNARQRYELSAHGRNMLGHDCDYEEAIYNKYPAVAGAMRSSSYRY
uniref:Uncharacterized protein n=1 Tax=Compsopogon caeruleus TaxID=31354 RepID=A0A6T6C3B5_9RHOD|mmetsp:Transcript_3450/g.6475  ORF Transcript_3450/g.6475 Transcript_3450/m.6475 type:complete len:294 (+) Transcript_3450:143-1024(+)|eukprot:CAMPEP_0184679014 /NCGR_PEP_ID=MMETSP0312-20130426/1828_1 /TAXON_ID=31354 /ORGANISM="Compsopogon coeruleus, Strain SAG 36.94" /LENGTH=293 /DNA_ID=CAMNT_0027128185 /DNA_START=95 /DNA_END=976 /DNA_ORIENTATION=+